MVSASTMTLDVVIADQGKWRVPDADAGFRGRGLLVIRGLAGNVTLSPAEHGTTIRMRWLRG